MSLQDFGYLVSIAELGSFTAAASRHKVSQPTLSIQIQKYEERVGIKIFNRESKGVIVTPEGRFIIEQARKILKLDQEIQSYAESLSDPEAGQLRLAAFSSIASYVLPEMSKKINQQFPKLKLFLIEEKTSVIEEQLNLGEIDCAILAEGTIHSDFNSEKLFFDEFYLAVNQQHKLANRKTIKLSDLQEYQIILLSEGHCLRDQVNNICQLSGIREENFQATSMTTLIEMVKLGTGITLIPEIARTAHPELVYIKIAKPAPARQINFYYSKNSSKKELLGKLYKIIA